MPWKMQTAGMQSARHRRYAKIISVAFHDGIRGNPNKSIIPESDLYRLITNAQSPKVELFKNWLYEQVLPTIRKTGSYSIKCRIQSWLFPTGNQRPDPAKLQEMFAITLKELQNKKRNLAAQGKELSRRFNPRP
jgi:prophage antirepressor-like protein